MNPDRSSAATEDATDEDLVARMRSGDDAVWAQLLARYHEVLQRQASKLARASGETTAEARADELSDIYLFLVELVRRSLEGFEGRCQVKTWVYALIGNRGQVMKSYLLHKDPSRADIRVPVTLRGCSATEEAIYRQLVWGLAPQRVALELGVREVLCWEMEERLARESPRVYERIRANRMARARPVRIAATDADDPEAQILPASGADALSEVIRGELEGHVHQELDGVLAGLTSAERRLLFLLYDEGMSAAQIVELAEAGDPGLEGLSDLNRCYYLKDRALKLIEQRIVDRLTREGYEPAPLERRRVLQCIEEVLRARGVPMSTPPDENQ